MTEHLLGTLAVVGPIAGLVIGAGVGLSRKQVVPLAAIGYLIGFAGLVAYMGWTVFEWSVHYDKHVRTPVSWRQNPANGMVELIDADTAELAVKGLALVMIGFGVVPLPFLARGSTLRRACWMLTLSGAVVRGLWCAYNWHCRYDPVTGYFGLEKVRVLGVNFAMFMATGIAMGVLWALMTTNKPVAGLLGGSVAERTEPPSHSATKQPNKET